MFCLAFYLCYGFLMMQIANPPILAFAFGALYFPTTLVTAVVELLYLGGKKKTPLLIGLVMDVMMTFLVSSFWVMMVLRGGSAMMAHGILSISINVLISITLGLQIYRRQKPRIK